MILVSACVLGECCRYDGGSCIDCCPNLLREMHRNNDLVLACPEQLGGLKVPRDPAEISGGDGGDVLDGKAKVINSQGEDVTAEYLKGAEKTLEICHALNITIAILKSMSPSCGIGDIYDGTFGKVSMHGDGVTAALLKRNGIKCISERDFTNINLLL